jgi:hypothetical protein
MVIMRSSSLSALLLLLPFSCIPIQIAGLIHESHAMPGEKCPVHSKTTLKTPPNRS